MSTNNPSNPNHKTNDQEARKQKRLRQLGTDTPACVVCGHDRWNALELHHLSGQAYGDQLVIVCRNCHRELSDPSDNSACPKNPSQLEQIGHLLIGLAQFLILLANRLLEAGRTLLDAAAVSPMPYGKVSA